jgi:hypothetical protein
MHALLKKSGTCFISKTTFFNFKRFNNFNVFNYTKKKLREEKYSYQEIQTIVEKLISQEHRNIHSLPAEFHKFSEDLIFLEKPVEPEQYECCGNGCCPCIWDKYDNKVGKFKNVIDMLYDKINDEN